MTGIITTWLGSQLPKAADAALRIVGIKLLGKIVEIPEAWLDGHVQGLRDKNRANTIISDALAAEVARKFANENALMSVIAQDMLENHAKKLGNKAAVFQRAVEHIVDDPSTADDANKIPKDDWLNAFGTISEDICSDELRERFARILAGELKSPGSFSIATLRAVSGMSQTVASEFAETCRELISDFVFKSPKYGRGEDWLRMCMLRDEGLFSPVESSIHEPQNSAATSDGVYHWHFGPNHCLLNIQFTPGSGSEIPIFNLTNVGREIARILPEPEYENNIRAVASQNVKRAGWVAIDLYVDGFLREKLA